MTMRQGSIVDATLIAAPNSTSNKEGKRDPEMLQTKEGNQWYSEMKVYTGVYTHSGLILSVAGMAANVQDLAMAARMLHYDADAVCGHAGYVAISKRPEMEKEKAEFGLAMRPGKRRALPYTPEGKPHDLI